MPLSYAEPEFTVKQRDRDASPASWPQFDTIAQLMAWAETRTSDELEASTRHDAPEVQPMIEPSRGAPVPVNACSRLAYLPALDGLRGVAVAMVVAFHAHWLTGGYLGVDLFFVLSGFLITRLLLHEYRTSGRIDLVGFWKRRARRLLPAMIVVTCFAALVERSRGTLDGSAGGRRDVVGALTYTSNWLRLDSGAGYWRQFAGPALLDHMWSLAIEEQFYVVWPLVVFGLLWLVRSAVMRVLIFGVGACGLGLWALWLFHTTSDASRVYMGTDTRAVALLLGATAAAIEYRRKFSSRNRLLRLLALPALLLIVFMTVRMRGDALITYQGGLLACSLAGTIVVAAAALDRRLSATAPTPPAMFRVLTTAPLRWLGSRSYGIYLWHWPMMVGFHVADAPDSSLWRRLAAVGASLVVAELSYRYIEQPIRNNGLHAFHRVVGAFPIGLVAVAMTFFAVLAPPLHTASARTMDARREEVALPAVPLPTFSAPASTSTTTVTSTVPADPAGLPKTASTAPLAPSVTSTVPATTPPAPVWDGPPPRVMVVGDSVGRFLGSHADFEHERLGIEVVNAAHDFCPLSYTPLRRRLDASSVPMSFADNCEQYVNGYRETVAAAQPDVVLMIFGMSFLLENEIAPGTWFSPCSAEFDGWFQDQIRMSVEALSSTGATVYWVTQGYYRVEVGDWTPLLDDQVDCVNARAREVVAQSNGAMGVIELGPWVCPTRDCLIERDGYVLRPDGSHFVDQGASLANIWMLSQIFNPPPWTATT